MRGREAKHMHVKSKAHQRGVKCVQERREAGVWGVRCV